MAYEHIDNEAQEDCRKVLEETGEVQLLKVNPNTPGKTTFVAKAFYETQRGGLEQITRETSSMIMDMKRHGRDVVRQEHRHEFEKLARDEANQKQADQSASSIASSIGCSNAQTVKGFLLNKKK